MPRSSFVDLPSGAAAALYHVASASSWTDRVSDPDALGGLAAVGDREYGLAIGYPSA